MSFSKEVKREILVPNGKLKLCCAFSFVYGLTFPLKKEINHYIVKLANAENDNLAEEIVNFLNSKKKVDIIYKNGKMLVNTEIVKFSTFAEIEQSVLKCQNCKEYFFKGLFVSCGTVNDPEKSYQLDLNIDNFEKASELAKHFKSIGIYFKLSKRNNKYFLYLKRNDEISDFLAVVGANTSVFAFMNSKINKEIRNTANRMTNCDSANINKAISASQKYISAINELIEMDLYESMPENLKEIAKLRLEYSSLSFNDLGLKCNPTVSKSGVYHRLERIIDFYNKAKENKN